MEERKSRHQRPPIVLGKTEQAQKEADNGIRQYDLVAASIDTAVSEKKNGKKYRLRPSDLLTLNRCAIDGLSELAGVFRPGEMEITNSDHIPPPADEVPRLVEELCEYVNNNWDKSAIHLSAYIMWRLNWIHPFDDGNGRTSRAAAYQILCIKLDGRLPGVETIPDQISRAKKTYYDALIAADRAWSKSQLDLSQMEELITAALAKQFTALHSRASDGRK